MMIFLIWNSVGRAGYIAGAIWINSVFNKEIIKLNDLYRICDSVVRSGQEYVARKSNSRQRLPPLMYSYYDTEYLGGNSTENFTQIWGKFFSYDILGPNFSK